MIERNKLSEIGKFQRTHALKGELNAIFDIDPEELLERDRPLIIDIDGIFVPFFIESLRPKGSFSYLVKLSDLDTEDEAKPFVNKLIYCLKEDLPEDEGDEEGMYADSLIGYTIEDSTHGVVGEIEELDLSTENALFVVAGPDDTKIYVPIADDLIDGVDDEKKVVNMTLPEGLISINQKIE